MVRDGHRIGTVTNTISIWTRHHNVYNGVHNNNMFNTRTLDVTLDVGGIVVVMSALFTTTL